MPPPFTFAPRTTASSASLVDVHNTGVVHTNATQEIDEEMGEPGEEDEDEEEEEEEEGDDEGQVDVMAIEEQEQSRDAAGLEEPGNLPADD